MDFSSLGSIAGAASFFLAVLVSVVMAAVGLKKRWFSQTKSFLKGGSQLLIPHSIIPGPHGPGGFVKGDTHNDWLTVRYAFQDNFAQNLEKEAQLAVYKDSLSVMNLCGNSKSNSTYSDDTLQCIFSSGKNMEAICIMVLVDRGRLAYDDLVCKHWPEFGKYGKDLLTISDVLRHEGGLPFFANPANTDNGKCDTRLTVDDILNVHQLDKVIEQATKFGARHYHATTRGWILSGIIRRVDEKKRTLGQFMRDEICKPFGLDIFCGISPNNVQPEKYDFAEVKLPSLSYILAGLVLPMYLGIGTDPTLKNLMAIATRKDGFGRRHRTTRFAKDLFKWVSSPEGRALEWPSVAMQGNAKSIAKIAALLANGGEIDGMRLVSQKTVALALSEPKYAYDPHLLSHFSFTKGGFAKFDEMDAPFVSPAAHVALKGFYGWGGFGGSWFVFHPSKRVGLGYVPTGLAVRGLGGATSDGLLSAVAAVLQDDPIVAAKPVE